MMFKGSKLEFPQDASRVQPNLDVVLLMGLFRDWNLIGRANPDELV